MSPTLRIEIRPDQPIERDVFETGKILVSLLGDLCESLATDQSLIECDRQIGFLADVFTLMIEFELELAADELERLLGVVFISQ